MHDYPTATVAIVATIVTAVLLVVVVPYQWLIHHCVVSAVSGRITLVNVAIHVVMLINVAYVAHQHMATDSVDNPQIAATAAAIINQQVTRMLARIS
jgi:hypothetical protein